MTEETPKTPVISIMSRKRLGEIRDAVKMQYGTEGIDELMNKICEIMKFDPTKKTYTKEKGQKMLERRKELSEKTGLSTYVLCGGKANYEKKKQMKSI